jgi:hypothetical protein
VFMRIGEFDALRAAYAMNDADLWRTLTEREQAAGATPEPPVGGTSQ